MCVAVSQSTRLCSMSTVSQANPARAINRAAVILPSESHVPTDGWPAFKARLTGLGRIRTSRSHFPKETRFAQRGDRAWLHGAIIGGPGDRRNDKHDSFQVRPLGDVPLGVAEMV